MTALIALLGAGVGTGLLLIAGGLRPAEPSTRRSVRRLIDADARQRLMRAGGAALVILLTTRWPVAAVACGLLGCFSSDLLGGRSQRAAGVARTEAIATWTEMLRDTIAAAHGLEAAAAATAPVAPAPIRHEVIAFSVRIQHEPLGRSLHHLADDLAHPIADLVVAALTVAANGSVRNLAELLSALADAARDEAVMQLRVEAARARMRTAVRVIAGCTVATAAGLVLLNPRYVAVYGDALGQLTLAVIAASWGAALWWLAHMSRFQAPERFLLSPEAPPAGAAR